MHQEAVAISRLRLFVQRNPQIMKLLYTTSLALILLATTPASQAALLFYEGFNYTANSTVAGQGGWTTPGTSLNTAASSLAYSTLQTSGRSAVNVPPAGGDEISILTGISSPLSGNRWVSFLLQQDAGITDFQRLRVIFGDVGGNEMIQVGTSLGNANSNKPVFATGGSFPFFNGGIVQSLDTGFTGPTAALFVMKYDYTNAAITAYFNPTPGTAEGSLTSLGVIVTTAPAQMSLGRFRIQATNIYNGNAFADEFRIGDTWSDVSPIPEPSTVALLVLSGGVGLMILRRRRSCATA